MAVFDRIMRAGETRILRKLEAIAHQVADLEEDYRDLSDDELQGPDRGVQGAVRRRRVARRPDGRGVRGRPRGCPAHPGPAPLRRPGDGRRGAAPRQHRRDEDRRGQDPDRRPAGVPQRAVGQGRPRRHDQRLPRQARRRVDGPGAPVPRPDGRRDPRRASRRSSAARSTPATSPTARTTSSASTTCATTWRGAPTSSSSAATTTRSSTRSTRS